MAVFLAPAGQIPTFAADDILVLPTSPNPRKAAVAYSGGLAHGTCIKLYNYRWGTRSLATTNVRSKLETDLYNLALPVRISETRNGFSANYFQATLSGLGVNISSHREDKNGSRIEENFCQIPLRINLPHIGELSSNVTVFKAKDNNGEAYDVGNIPHGVLFTVNGQVHFRAAPTFIGQRLGYHELSKYMLVSVDCTRMDPDAAADFFMTSRDRTAEQDVRKALENAVVHHLAREDSPLRTALRALNARRREEELKDVLNDDEPARVLEELIRTSPSLASLFSIGTKIRNIATPGKAEPLFKGRRFPTFFKIRKEPGGGLIKSCPINRTCRVEFETDAENEYFNRPESPGSIQFSPAGINGSWTLFNGRLGATFLVPPNARVGDEVVVHAAISDETQLNPLTCVFDMKVTAAVSDPPKRPPGERKPSGGVRLAIPNIYPVTRDGRAADGQPSSIKWNPNNGFNEYTALAFRPFGDEGKFDVLINFDNIYLHNELRCERKTSEHPAILYCFKYGLTLAALAMMQEQHRQRQAIDRNGHDKPTNPVNRISANRERNGDQPRDSVDGNAVEAKPDSYAEIRAACSGIASVIVPVIMRLAEKSVPQLVDA